MKTITLLTFAVFLSSCSKAMALFLHNGSGQEITITHIYENQAKSFSENMIITPERETMFFPKITSEINVNTDDCRYEYISVTEFLNKVSMGNNIGPKKLNIFISSNFDLSIIFSDQDTKIKWDSVHRNGTKISPEKIFCE